VRGALKAQAHGDPVCKSDSVTLSFVKEPTFYRVYYDSKKKLVPIIPTINNVKHQTRN